MALSAAPADQTNHHELALRTLRQLADCESDGDPAQFWFEVQRHRCSRLTAGNFEVVDLSLATYNDLKVSQYILEEDHSSTRDERYFRVTPLGRSVAASASH